MLNIEHNMLQLSLVTTATGFGTQLRLKSQVCFFVSFFLPITNSYIFSDYVYTIKNHQRNGRWPSPLATKETATVTAAAAAAAATTTGAAAREAEEAGVAPIPSYFYVFWK